MTGFEDWWLRTYKGQLGSFIIEESFKEVALAAWNEAQIKVEYLEDKILQLEIENRQLETYSRCLEQDLKGT